MGKSKTRKRRYQLRQAQTLHREERARIERINAQMETLDTVDYTLWATAILLACGNAAKNKVMVHYGFNEKEADIFAQEMIEEAVILFSDIDSRGTEAIDEYIRKHEERTETQ